jgi:hypothetical protein
VLRTQGIGVAEEKKKNRKQVEETQKKVTKDTGLNWAREMGPYPAHAVWALGWAKRAVKLTA